jgi:hypothetical protein
LEKQTKKQRKKRKKESPFLRAVEWACQGFCEKKITEKRNVFLSNKADGAQKDWGLLELIFILQNP